MEQKKYELTDDGVTGTLKRLTPKNLKILQRMGLLSLDENAIMQAMADVNKAIFSVKAGELSVQEKMMESFLIILGNVKLFLQRLLTILLNSEDTKEFVNAIFEVSGEIKDWESLNGDALIEGFQDFFSKHRRT